MNISDYKNLCKELSYEISKELYRNSDIHYEWQDKTQEHVYKYLLDYSNLNKIIIEIDKRLILAQMIERKNDIFFNKMNMVYLSLKNIIDNEFGRIKVTEPLYIKKGKNKIVNIKCLMQLFGSQYDWNDKKSIHRAKNNLNTIVRRMKAYD